MPSKDDLELRVLQWPSFMAPFTIFRSKEPCAAFGFSVDFDEANPMGYNLTG